MPDYTVRLPDGRQVTVRNAPDEASARARVQQEFNLPPSESAQPSQSEQAGQTYARMVNSLLEQTPIVGQGADALLRSFNLSDEATGLAARGAGALRNLVRGESADLGEMARGASREEQRQVSQYRQEQPLKAMAEEAAAQGVAAWLTAGAAPSLAAGLQTAARTRPVVTAMGTGAAMGGAVGAGEGGTPQERLGNAAEGATMGAMMGPLGVYGARAAGGASRAVGRLLGRQQPPSRGVSALMSQVDEAMQAGTPEGSMLGERMGPQGEELLVALGQRQDEAGRIVRDAARQRAANRTQRVMSEVQLRTGNRRGVEAIADAAEAESLAVPMFRAADEVQLPAQGRLRELVRAAEQEGVNVGRASGRQARGELRLDALLSDDRVQGAVSGASVRSLIADVEDAASSAFQSGQGNQGRRLAALQRDLRGYLRSQSPEFDEASRIWRSAQQDREAFRLGASVFDEGKNRAEIEGALRDFIGGADQMSASERGQFMSGVLDAIERKTATVGTGGNAASRLTRQGIQDRLAIVFGQDEAGALADFLDTQVRQGNLERIMDPTANSATAMRSAAAGAEDVLAAGPGRQTTARAIEATGDFLSSPVTGVRRLAAGSVRGRMAPSEAESLARVLTQQDASAEMQRFLQAIEQERLRRGMVGTAGVGLGTFGAGQSAPRQ